MTVVNASFGKKPRDRLWLQVRGDPSVRDFVFQQTRVESEFDRNVDRLIDTVARLFCEGRIFHAVVHFSSNQLTCWSYADPYRYTVSVGNAVLAPEFPMQFARTVGAAAPTIPYADIVSILREFKRLRFKDPNMYLRNGSINVMNGVIGLAFSCDGSHYLSYNEFQRVISHY